MIFQDLCDQLLVPLQYIAVLGKTKHEVCLRSLVGVCHVCCSSYNLNVQVACHTKELKTLYALTN